MKTCSMCGTLLFDDVMICTKCGHNLSGKVTKDTTAKVADEEMVEEPETTTPEEEETTIETGSEIKPDEAQDKLMESSEKRKQWLEEQEKIKAELASIMSRVGKKQSLRRPLQVGPVATGQAQIPPGLDPFHKPVGVTPRLSPMGIQTGPTTSGSAQISPIEQDEIDSGAPIESQEAGGLSDFDKQELLRELDDLRNEGYKVSRLEKIIEEDPANAWKSFSAFLDDIEHINQERSRLDELDTEEFPELTAKKNEILSKMGDPDLLPEIKNNIEELEKQLSAAKEKVAVAPAPIPSTVTVSGAVKDKKTEQLEKFIALGKDAIKQKDYEKALKIFSKTLELDPNNKEILFFKKKLEAKIAELGEPGLPTIQQVQAPAQVTVQVPPRTQVTAQSPTRPITVPQQPTQTAIQPQRPVTPTPFYQQPTDMGEQKKKKKKKKKISASKPSFIPGVPRTPTQAQVPTPKPAPTQIPTPKPAPPPAQAVNIENDSMEGPKSAAEYEALGFNAYINKDYPKALEFFEKVLEIDPTFPNVENLKNECLMRLGKA